MNWRDQLQQGKFRDVAFRTSAAELVGGRRVAVHEYPHRDAPYPEDLGRKAHAFSLQLYVLGNDYMAARDQLLSALDKKGPGTLVHHYLGTLRVQVVEYRLIESTRDGGMARFSVSFVEAGDNRLPAQRADTPAIVASRADTAHAENEARFDTKFSVTGQPQFVSDAASSLLTTAMGKLTALSEAVPTIPAEAAKFQQQLGQVSSQLSTLLLSPATLASQVTGFIRSFPALVSRPLDALSLTRQLFDFGNDTQPVTGSTPALQQQADNQQAITLLVQRAAVVEASRVASTVPFDSRDAALMVRDELSDQLDIQTESADDDTYAVFTDLRVAMVTDINARGADLARVVSYTPATTLPVLVVAHRIYGDITQEADIVSRNGIVHPGFVPGGQALEVLSRV